MNQPDPSVALARDLLRDTFTRVREDVADVLQGLSAAEVLWRPDQGANSIAWLVWHLARVQDDHMADLGERQQAWQSEGWFERFALPYPQAEHGYGHTAEQVGAFTLTDPSLLGGYQQAAHQLTLAVLDGMSASDYSRVVDIRWDPPVTAAVRVVSVVNDLTQHVGQAALLRGLLQRGGIDSQLREER